MEVEIQQTKKSGRSKELALAGIIICIIIIALIVGLVVGLKKDKDNIDNTAVANNEKIRGNKYSKAAVAADRHECSEIGKNMLQKGGTAVDAAVAATFCVGLLNMHSCGIGGGGFMNVYLRDKKKSIVYDFRETAPASATERMFLQEGASSTVGGLAIGIPGNVKGMHHVWTKHGKLSWRELIEPTIKIATDGFYISKVVGKAIADEKNKFNDGFKKFLMKDSSTWYKEGDFIKNPDLAATLKRIQDDPHDFYNGTLAKEIVREIQDAGGIITEEDLKQYTVAERETLKSVINGNHYLFMPPPGGGAVVAMTINVLKGYNLTEKNVKDEQGNLVTTHRVIEAMKFAFARRPLLGDPSFEANVTKVTDAMFDQVFTESLRKKIKASPYPNQTYYGGFYSQSRDPFGTTHISILAENGDAVAVTDTINYGFGGGVRSKTNGIIYNNEMDDFSTPGIQNLWGYLPAPANYIKPGKRPLSSMSPTIVTDSNGDVIMVVGASGGSRIITGTAQTMIRKMFLNMDLGKAVSDPRIHTHLLPYKVYVNKVHKQPQYLLDGLKDFGHDIELSNLASAVQTVYREKKDSDIYAVSDPRKGGKPAGY